MMPARAMPCHELDPRHRPKHCTTRLFGRTGAATPSVIRFVSTQRKCQISPMRPYPLIAFALCFFTASGRADPAPKPDFTAAEKQIQTWVDNGAYPGALLWIESEDGATLYDTFLEWRHA